MPEPLVPTFHLEQGSPPEYTATPIVHDGELLAVDLAAGGVKFARFLGGLEHVEALVDALVEAGVEARARVVDMADPEDGPRRDAREAAEEARERALNGSL